MKVSPRIVAASAPDAIAAAVAALRQGGLVGIPTETVYGLAADARNPTAVARIFAAKGRPRFNPLIVHVADADKAAELAVMSEESRRLARAFWPGPLTLVMPGREGNGIADLTTAGLSTLAVRVPAHPVARMLLTTFAGPLAAPSANRSGHVSATTAQHVADDLGSAVALILDAGPTSVGIESTIVGLAGGQPVLLRAGGLDRAEIERVLGRPLATPAPNNGAPQAPGMLASHYAPRASLRMDATDLRSGEGYLAFGSLPAEASAAVAIRNLSPSGDLIEAAANLFAALRELDNSVDRIAVAPIPDRGLGEAINDRLRRAAAPRG